MESEGGAYVIFVYPISNYQRFRNAMMRNCSILANYDGRLVCSAPEVTPIEGNWRTNRTVAILHFATARQATSYLQSEPLVKQPDFMDGMDVCIVQAKGYPPRGKDLFVLADVNVYDTRRFAEEYVPQTAEIKNNGQVFVSAACHNPINHRGTWRPSLIILNQWGSEADYYSFYNSADYQPLKELRQRITNSNVIAIMHKYE